MGDANVLPSAIQEATQRLACATEAESIILFGSRARGDWRGDSDWDLCVILSDSVEPGKFTPVTLWPLVSGFGVPIQVYPIRRSIFNERRGDLNSLSHDIDRDGIVLFEKRRDRDNERRRGEVLA
jgi:predicted nucleotidyltransferase